MTKPTVPRLYAVTISWNADESRFRSHDNVWGSMSTDADPDARSTTDPMRPYAWRTASVQFRPSIRSGPIRWTTGECRSSNVCGRSGSGSLHRTMSPG